MRTFGPFGLPDTPYRQHRLHRSLPGLSFRIGRWTIAASLIHELIHTCGQPSHDIGDRAKGVCGRLPDV